VGALLPPISTRVYRHISFWLHHCKSKKMQVESLVGHALIYVSWYPGKMSTSHAQSTHISFKGSFVLDRIGGLRMDFLRHVLLRNHLFLCRGSSRPCQVHLCLSTWSCVIKSVCIFLAMVYYHFHVSQHSSLTESTFSCFPTQFTCSNASGPESKKVNLVPNCSV